MDALDQAQAQEDALLRRRIAVIARSGSGSESGSGEDESPASRDCAGCGAPIPAKRLRALPAARLCIDCQREVEG